MIDDALAGICELTGGAGDDSMRSWSPVGALLL